MSLQKKASLALYTLETGNVASARALLLDLVTSLEPINITGQDMRTSFQRVADMNTAFSNPKGEFHAINGKKLLSQCKNIIKEYEELMAAFEANDVDKIRDALCDIQVFAMGAQHFMGVDGDRDMAEVVDAVMTRFCATPAQLAATQAHYAEKGVRFYAEGEYPQVCLKSSEDQGYTPGNPNPEYPKGKFLKALGYREPVFYKPSRPAGERKFMGQAVAAPPPGIPEIKGTPQHMMMPGKPPAPTGGSVVQDMAAMREQSQEAQATMRERIEEAVSEFRSKMEREFMGLPAYDSKLNNTPEDKLAAPTK